VTPLGGLLDCLAAGTLLESVMIQLFAGAP
jgi:hypothetical protein